jgi:hypothetical protein
VAIKIPAEKSVQLGNTLYSDTGIRTNSPFTIKDSVIIDKTPEGVNIGMFNLRATFIDIETETIHSGDFIPGQAGYAIYVDADGNRIVEADKFVERSPTDTSKDKIVDINGTDNFYVTQYSNIVKV